MSSGASITRAIRLEVLTATWAVVEATGSLIAGLAAGSVALVAFGADSAIEMISALIVLAQLRRGEDDQLIHRSLKMVAILFFVLAAYVVVAALVALTSKTHPEPSALGIIVAGSSVVLMPLLARAKTTTGADLQAEGSSVLGRLLIADGAETWLCAVLGITTLLGVVASTALHWWWADPVASFVVVYFALREGVEAWRGELD